MAMEISNNFKYILCTRVLNAVCGNSNAVKYPELNYAGNADLNITVTTAAHNFISFHEYLYSRIKDAHSSWKLHSLKTACLGYAIGHPISH
jgi:sarcosine oxidase delta subunit